MHFINNNNIKSFVQETISFIEFSSQKALKSTTDLCLDRRFSLRHIPFIYVCHGHKPHVNFIDRSQNHPYVWMKWRGRGRNNNGIKQFAWVELWAIKSQQIYQWPKGIQYTITHTHKHILGKHFINRNMCLP